MNLKQAIEKNKNWLQAYSTLSRIIGWLLIFIGGVILIVGLFEMGKMRATRGFYTTAEMKFMTFAIEPLLTMILPGLLSLLAAQLLHFLLNDNLRPGWLLTKGDKILYLTAIIVLLNFIPFLRHAGNMLGPTIISYASMFAMFFGVMLPSILILGAKLIILVGFAQALHRIMPIIKESKSLV